MSGSTLRIGEHEYDINLFRTDYGDYDAYVTHLDANGHEDEVGWVTGNSTRTRAVCKATKTAQRWHKRHACAAA